jgi:hypothetical protein
LELNNRFYNTISPAIIPIFLPAKKGVQKGFSLLSGLYHTFLFFQDFFKKKANANLLFLPLFSKFYIP